MLNLPQVAAHLADALAVGLPGPLAYIGPGAGLGGIAVLVALLLGVLLLVMGLVWYPLKRFLNGRKGNAAGSGQTEEVE